MKSFKNYVSEQEEPQQSKPRFSDEEEASFEVMKRPKSQRDRCETTDKQGKGKSEEKDMLMEMKVQYYKNKCSKLKLDVTRYRAELRDKNEQIKKFENLSKDMESLKAIVKNNQDMN